jgi:prepilin-type N-terminal cleavage/methylation domain-containing protein
MANGPGQTHASLGERANVLIICHSKNATVAGAQRIGRMALQRKCEGFQPVNVFDGNRYVKCIAAEHCTVGDFRARSKAVSPLTQFATIKSIAMQRTRTTAGFARQNKTSPERLQPGFSLIELLIGMSIMAVALLSIAAMFSTGYTDVTGGGKTTMATAAARQMIEDMQTLNFNNIANLHNFDTANPATLGSLTAGTPEYTLARKWRYTLAGPGTGWPTYSTAEEQMWSTLSASGVPLGVRGLIQVASPAATLREVTVTVFLPGRTPNDTVPVRLATVITRL